MVHKTLFTTWPRFFLFCQKLLSWTIARKKSIHKNTTQTSHFKRIFWPISKFDSIISINKRSISVCHSTYFYHLSCFDQYPKYWRQHITRVTMNTSSLLEENFQKVFSLQANQDKNRNKPVDPNNTKMPSHLKWAHHFPSHLWLCFFYFFYFLIYASNFILLIHIWKAPILKSLS